MAIRKDIQKFVDLVVRQFHPGMIILFGSHAYGSPSHDSDVDLLVVMPYAGSRATTATRIRLACPRSFPMDLIIRTPSELRSALRRGDPFFREVTSKGVVLHESRNARVGR